MKRLVRLILVLTISIFALTACGGGGGLAGGSDGGDTGGGVSQSDIKEEIRLSVLFVNSNIAGLINSADDVINNAVNTLDCNFNAAISAPLTINGASHSLYAQGHAVLYSSNTPVDCNYFFDSETISINKADISGSGYVNGSELNSNFQGQFGVTGNGGYLASGDIYSGIYIADFLIINGSGAISNTVYTGRRLPDVSWNVSSVTVKTAEAWSLLGSLSAGGNTTLGELARTVKSGDVYVQSSDCLDIHIRFNGTDLIDVYSSCTSPSYFKVNADTGKIIE